MTHLNNKSLYKRYINLLNFLENKEFRNLKVLDEKLDKKTFIKNIICNEFIKISVSNEQKENIFVFMFNVNSKYIRGLTNFRTLISARAIKIKIHKLFLISNKSVSNKLKKYLKHIAIPFENINLKYFVTDISKGPLVPIYKKLSASETEEFMNNCNIEDLSYLPKILKTDPQVMYRGGKIGDIFQIQDISAISETVIRYRIVIRGKN